MSGANRPWRGSVRATLVASILLGAPGIAATHPHVFVDYSVTLVLAGDSLGLTVSLVGILAELARRGTVRIASTSSGAAYWVKGALGILGAAAILGLGLILFLGA
jgi:hypothetical protein